MAGRRLSAPTDWLQPLARGHTLTAGSTGAGKNSIGWSPIVQPVPAIRDGLVRVSGIDPKGMELAYGRRISTSRSRPSGRSWWAMSRSGRLGLVLNAALGWWRADPLVALGLAVVAVREGRNALRGDTCCAPVRPDCTSPCCAGSTH